MGGGREVGPAHLEGGPGPQPPPSGSSGLSELNSFRPGAVGGLGTVGLCRHQPSPARGLSVETHTDVRSWSGKQEKGDGAELWPACQGLTLPRGHEAQGRVFLETWQRAGPRAHALRARDRHLV